jgi:hypothetical protein
MAVVEIRLGLKPIFIFTNEPVLPILVTNRDPGTPGGLPIK